MEHFSRYAAPGDSDDDEDDEEDERGQQGREQEDARKGQKYPGGHFSPVSDGDGMQEVTFARDLSDVDEADVMDVTGAMQGDMEQEAGMQDYGMEGEEGPRYEDGGTPLQHSLPNLLGLSPQELLRLKESFFDGGGAATEEEAVAAATPPVRMQYGSSSKSAKLQQQQQQQQPGGMFGSRHGVGLFGGLRSMSQDAAGRADVQDVSLEHNWVTRVPSLLQPPRASKGSSSSKALIAVTGAHGVGKSSLAGVTSVRSSGVSAAFAVPPAQVQPLSLVSPAAVVAAEDEDRPSSSTSLSSNRHMMVAVAASAAAATPSGAGRYCLDASLLLGRSCRVGWGPNGALVLPAGATLVTAPVDQVTPGDIAAAAAVTAGGRSGQEGGQVDVIRVVKLSPLAHVAGDDPQGLSSSSSGTTSSSRGAASRVKAADAMRASLLQGLRVHLKRSIYMGVTSDTSAGDASGDVAMVSAEDGAVAAKAATTSSSSTRQGPKLPQWQLKVSGRDLGEVVKDQLGAAAASQAGGKQQQQQQEASPLGDSATSVFSHKSEAWRLLQVLFEHIEGEEDAPDPPDDGAPQSDEQAQEAEQSMWFKSRHHLAGFKRRAAFSRWLSAVVKPEVEQNLRILASGGSSSDRGGASPLLPTRQQQQGAIVAVTSSSPGIAAGSSSGGKGGQLLWAVLQLLSGHQRGGAVALAAAAGDVRLATLLAAGGAAAAGGADELAGQFKVCTPLNILAADFNPCVVMV